MELSKVDHYNAPCDLAGALGSNDPKYVIYKIISHMFNENVAYDFIDVGAFVGDVALRYANFSRTIGKPLRFYCFDPSLSGDLIPYNIELNGLGDLVEYHPVAVSGMDGLLLFCHYEGSSDGSQTARDPKQARNAIVPSIKLSRFIEKRGTGNSFIKLDTENMEQDILIDIRGYRNRSVNVICFEFAFHNKALRPVLEEMGHTHVLYDIGYVPTPFCCKPIETARMGDFYDEVSRRPFGYTDVMAISRNMPGLDGLMERLKKVTEHSPRYSIVFDDPGEHHWGKEQAGVIDSTLTGRALRVFRNLYRSYITLR